MKKMLFVALLAAAPLAACAEGYYGPQGPGPIAYDGFYDDYYGPINDGYWGDGGVFYYRSDPHGRFVADRDGHFRHDQGPAQGVGAGGRNFHEMHGSMTPPAHGHGGSGRHR